jgi:release factor glutamine methyltransferase
MRLNGWRWLVWRVQTTELHSWLIDAHNRLAPVSESPVLETHLLASHVLEQSRPWIVAHDDLELTQNQLVRLNELLDRLISGEPLPYLLGSAEFYGLTLKVNPAVLIPRPETELLVEEALRWLKLHPERRNAADVGTGSGAIALALAVHIPDLQVTAIDWSPEALEVARDNVIQHGVSERVRLLKGDILEGYEGELDLICANLPYIPTDTLKELDVMRHEPRTALDGGPDGLRLIDRLLKQVSNGFRHQNDPKDKCRKRILMEIETRQGFAVKKMVSQYFPEAGCEIKKDFSGHDRLVVVEFC